MPLNFKQKYSQRGISLIEVLVSMSIFSVGILGMSALQTNVLHENFDQHQRDIAIWQAQALIDRISVNKSGPALTQYKDSVSLGTLCDNPAPVVCADTADGAAATCTETQIATYDSWDSLCTSDQGAADVLTDFNATLSCGGSVTCNAGDNLTITFLWRSHTIRADDRFARATISSANISNIQVEGYTQVFRP